MRQGRRVIIVGMGILIASLQMSACYSYRSVVPDRASSGTVRVSFASPRTITVRGEAGTTVRADGVTQLAGQVERAETDTVYLRVRDIRGSGGIAPGVPIGGLAAVPREAMLNVEQRDFSIDRTLGLVLAGGAALAALLIYIAGRDEGGVVY